MGISSDRQHRTGEPCGTGTPPAPNVGLSIPILPAPERLSGLDLSSCDFTEILAQARGGLSFSSSQLLLKHTASQSGEGGLGSKRMLETGKGFPLEIHQENEQKPCPQEHTRNSPTQTGSTSGPQPDSAHELGKGTRMSAWEVTTRTPGWGITRPGRGLWRWNGRRWKICVCSAVAWEEERQPSPLWPGSSGEGGKGLAGFPTEAKDCLQRPPYQSRRRKGAARSDIRRDFPAVWAMIPCQGASRIFCCTDSTRERFLWAAQKPVVFGT